MEDQSKGVTIEQVRALLSAALQVPEDQITPDLAFGDIPQWDSMGHMEVIMSLENLFGVEISPDTITDLVSLPIIYNYLQVNGNA
jgi:acyl carrier protein